MVDPRALYQRLLLASAVAVGLLVVACRGDRRSVAGPEGSAEAEWTLLVYMAADDDLERAAIIDVQEMAEVGSSRRVNVVVQIDRGPSSEGRRGFVRAPLLDLPDFTTGKRLRVDRGGVSELADLGETDTGDSEVLADFVAWGMRTFPARKIALVMWGHGAGMDGFGRDFSSRSTLDIAGIRAAISRGLREGGRERLDLIGFDACFMGNLEVAYELRGVADVFVGAAGDASSRGWPYRDVIESLGDAESPIAVARALVDSYAAQCRVTETVGCTLAVLDQSRIETVARATEALGGELAATIASDAGWSAVSRARSDAREYGSTSWDRATRGLIDLGDFAGKAPASDAVRQQVADALARATIARAPGSGEHGLSISFPRAAGWRDNGASLEFAQLGGWQRLVRAYGARVGEGPEPTAGFTKSRSINHDAFQ